MEPKSSLFLAKILFTMAVVLGSLFCLTMDFDELTRFEKIICIGPIALILCVSIPLFIFFSNQIIDVTEHGEKVLFKLQNGKLIKCNKDKLTVKSNNSRYIIFVENGKKYSAYKYMPPNPLHHKYYISSKIDKLLTN